MSRRIRELSRVKQLGRELAGLTEMVQGISCQIPTFVPQPPSSDKELTTERLATALSPIPVRPPYHQTHSDPQHPNQPGQPMHDPMHIIWVLEWNPNLQNPKQKKLQFQTDQTKPFVFPFSRSTGNIPVSVEEAERLYKKHMHVSLALWQMWEVREACWREETGVDESVALGDNGTSNIKNIVSTGTFGKSDDMVDNTSGLSDVKKLEALIGEVENALNSSAEIDALRLSTSILPLLQPCVIVLLKLLLATVTATGAPPPNDLSLDLVSKVVLRSRPHPQKKLMSCVTREITSKAVSAILMLTLKWFKASHIMKFHHLGQLTGQQLHTARVEDVWTQVGICILFFATLDLTLNAGLRLLEEPAPPLPRIEDDIVQKPARGEVTDLVLVQYKSSAILKRILKVSHPILQLHVLKLLKSQVPYCGRKWQSNMKFITLIYLHCRPDLRDEWLSGTEVDDVVDAMVQEQALRTLVKFSPQIYQGYGAAAAVPPSQQYLSDLGEQDNYQTEAADALIPPHSLIEQREGGADEIGGVSAWKQLSKMSSAAEAGLADGISDSESIGSINILGDETRSESDISEADSADENTNNWAHMSPKTLQAMAKSPIGRRSSSGSGLRPVLPFGLDDGSAIPDDVELPTGPVPRSGTLGEGEGVDEVEYLYGE
ncbi:hypothetical protein RhiXN_04450 [Rhizoctonia solani]|uniref:Far11/STRP C-terminal domain-containing protein n=1 Tax=Rhizoctonia solani TaxID=456999 RepID=A0A8H8SSC7_9AGAM|nr:uncharacterized protein RhiXN_04450 [Rhizoctonia solani]QRW16449.1 hypothetical protein RhiXN_04450 [Rhizoctonia solani]